jgi:uncharacterized protein (DUF2141 family)
MRKLILCSAATSMAVLMLFVGCGKESAAPANTDSDSASSAESSTTEVAEADPAKGKITMADFEGFLPSDPIESVELTDEEKMASQMPADEGKEKVKPSKFVFEAPVRIKAGDEYVKVDAPGYACPTIADVDGDGKQDLVVGQFNKGKMRFFQNTSEDSDSPEFAAEAWIKTGDKVAEVPGVW